MPKKAEYELMPVKPLRDLKREFQKLKNELKQGDSSTKVLTKVLNANVEIKKKIDVMLKEQKRVTDNLKNVVSFFESIEETEEEEDVELKDIVKELKEQNKAILEQIQSLNEEIKRHRYFKERLPSGLSVYYQRTK